MGMTEQALQARAQDRNDFLQKVATSAGAYATGQVLGGLITIDNIATASGPIPERGLSAVLNDLAVIDNSGAAGVAVDLFFFNQQPATVMTDKAAFGPSTADMLNCIGVVQVVAADYVAAGAGSQIAAGKNQSNLGKILKPFASTALYCVPVTRGAPSYGVSGLALRFQFDA